MLNFKTITVFFGLLFLGLLLIDYYFEISIWWYVGLGSGWLVVTVIGSFSMRCNFHLKAFTSPRFVSEKKVAITFDDGPNAKYTPIVLSLLKKYNAKGTFFCVGKNIDENPLLLKLVHEQGHTIGNHSYSHSPWIDFLGRKKITAELIRTNSIVESLLGLKMKLFRPPYGVTNPAIAAAVDKTQHYVIGWNIRSFDTVINNPQRILNRITKSISPGAVILLHDGHDRIPEVLEHLLLFLKQQQYECVTVDTLFKIEPYA
jgi:peptidoglycan/xylan/chitin deacetylase (PgdA/CDA1 family)